MTAYDGATVRIKATATDYDGNAVTSSGVTSAVVSIYDQSGNYAVTNAALTWNATTSYWYYDWQNALPGTFTAVCTFTGTNFEAFDYDTFLVSPLKVNPTGKPTPIVGYEDTGGN